MSSSFGEEDESSKCQLCLESNGRRNDKNNNDDDEISERRDDKLVLVQMTCCSHQGCDTCLTKWIERLESMGGSKEDYCPSCPFCRQEMDEEKVIRVLGRPFQPATSRVGSTSTAHEDISSNIDAVDDLTQDWLEQYTKPCPRCNAHIMKEDETCDLMECLCGYRFCYQCGFPNAECMCTPLHHAFFDNVQRCPVFDRNMDEKHLQVAPFDQRGRLCLQRHIQKRMQCSVRMSRFFNRQDRDIEISLLEQQLEPRYQSTWLFLPTKEESLRHLDEMFNKYCSCYRCCQKFQQLKQKERSFHLPSSKAAKKKTAFSSDFCMRAALIKLSYNIKKSISK